MTNRDLIKMLVDQNPDSDVVVWDDKKGRDFTVQDVTGDPFDGEPTTQIVFHSNE